MCALPVSGLRRAEGLGLRVWSLGLKVWSLGLKVWGLGFRGLGFRASDLEFRAWSVWLGFRTWVWEFGVLGLWLWKFPKQPCVPAYLGLSTTRGCRLNTPVKDRRVVGIGGLLHKPPKE